MLDIKDKNLFNKISFIYFIKNPLFMLTLITIQINGLLSLYFESFKTGIINQNASLIDITDYHNLSLLITTDRNIYTGIPPQLISNTNSTIINISFAATYDARYILLSCSKKYLLSKINIETGIETPLIDYEDFNISSDFQNYYCSLCIEDNIAYVGLSRINTKLIKKKINCSLIDSLSNSLSDSLSDSLNDYCNSSLIEYYYEEYSVSYLQNFVVKAKFINNNDGNGPIINNKSDVILYNFEYGEIFFNKLAVTRQLSCEIISPNTNKDKPTLVCGYIKYDNKYKKYNYTVVVMNSEFNSVDDEKIVLSVNSLSTFRLQKINSYALRYLFEQRTVEIYLNNKESKYLISSFPNYLIKNYLFQISGLKDLFYYNNNYIFSVIYNNLYIKSNFTNIYIMIKEQCSPTKKVIGFYDESSDLLEFIYQCSNSIKYFTLQNITKVFSYKCNAKYTTQISNQPLYYNVSELINNMEHEPLKFKSATLYKAFKDEDPFSNYSFDKSSQNLTVYPSLNNWVKFSFYYYEVKEDNIKKYIELPSCYVFSRTCAYGCKSCSKDYSKCDPGDCRLNFAKYHEEDEICYDIYQNFPNYIYANDTNLYEKCYPTCKFCSKKESLSSNISHNCKICDDGYLKSYRYMGNCYKIEYPLNNSNISKMVDNVDNYNYTIVNSCLENNYKYIIASTGECVSQCPKTSNYYLYKKNFDKFNVQSTSRLSLQYSLTKENPPKFLFGYLCYQTCPNFTTEDSINNLCKCNNGWVQNSTTLEITCYDDDNCLSKEYYYHSDTKECVFGGCREGYYQFNFECFKQCPNDTIPIDSDIKICESNLTYCYIDEKYKTNCSNIKPQDHNLRYNQTNIYFKNCNESLFFFNIKTYLYKNICYEICPENTIKNDTNNECSCKYYKKYSDEEYNDYKCLSKLEVCKNYKQYNIFEKNECLQECIDNNYKIFNDQCYLECPEKTTLQEDNYTCLCSYYYYNESNSLLCLDPGATCEAENYPFKNIDTKECFKIKEECMERNFSIFNNICMDKCPKNTEAKDNDKICYCSYYYYNESNILTCFNSYEICGEKGYNYTNFNTKECFKTKEDCNKRGYNVFENECCDDCDNKTFIDDNYTCICRNYFYNKNNNLICFYLENSNQMINYTINITYNKKCFDTKENCLERGFYFFNNLCYDECPKNTELRKNEQTCYCSYNYINESNKFICLNYNETCQSKGYNYTDIETNECLMSKDDCINKGLKVFNYNCSNNCPENTKLKEDNSTCICSNYFYEEENNYLKCFTSTQTCETQNYSYKNIEEKECFKTKEQCIQKGLKIFGNQCYNNCPKDTIDKNNDNLCVCTNYTLYNDNNLIKCLESENDCLSNGYYYDKDIKECYLSDKKCVQNNKKIFEKECLDICPINSEIKQNSSICECSYYYSNDNGKKICFNQNKTCETEGYITSHDSKECYRGIKIVNNGECPDDFPYINILSNLCVKECDLNDYFTNICQLNSNITKYNDDIVKNIQNDLKNGNLEQLLINNIDENKQDLTIKKDNVLYSITSSDNQNKNRNFNTSTIKLGECEEKIRKHYNMSENDTLYIFKTEYYDEGLLIPLIQYEIYNLKEKEKLDMNICKDTKIEILIPVSINEDNLFMYNSSHEYYNDICYPYTTESGTDIILSDRRNQYTKNNLSLCENNCEYNKYDKYTKRVTCNCNVITEINTTSNIKVDENTLIKKFIDFKSMLNLKVLKCYKLLWYIDGLKTNIGSYVMLSIIIMYIILLIIFLKKQYKTLMHKIDEIIDSKKISKNTKNEIFDKKESDKSLRLIKKENYMKKDDIFENSLSSPMKRGKRKNSTKINVHNIKQKESHDLNSLRSFRKLKSNNEKMKKVKDNYLLNIKNNNKEMKETSNELIVYNDYEMNYLSYKKALKYDKRSYCQYYLSLLRTKHILIFTCYTYNDYNLRVIKLCLFIFSFALYFTVNALFFTDSTMHKIYENKGKFNIFYNLSQILYSSLISIIINIIIKSLSLSEKDIIKIKKMKKNIQKKANKIKNCLIARYIIFFFLSFILLFFFWYYLSCFCAVYKNTQKHLIKDTFISFLLSLLYPFGINLIPGLFRIPSLNKTKKKRKCLYIVSQFVQLF